MFDTTQKIGILGGGQLGKMLCLAAANWDFKTCVLDAAADYPAGAVAAEFTAGNFNNYDDVLAFGQDKSVLTIEIEHVNTDALRVLERQGKAVHPRPDALDLIKDKGLQKTFFQENNIPTAEFELFDHELALRQAVESGRWQLPLVQKTRTAARRLGPFFHVTRQGAPFVGAQPVAGQSVRPGWKRCSSMKR